MAPRPGLPMTPSRNFEKSQSRKFVPVVPAIPRSLEKKPKPREQTPTHTLAQEANNSPAPEKQESRPAEEESLTSAPAQDFHNGASAEADAQGGVFRGIGILYEDGGKGEMPKDPKIFNTQDFGNEKHGFRLPPPFYPKMSPPAAISTDISSTNGQTDTSQDTTSSHPESVSSGKEQLATITRKSPLRGAAPVFCTHPPSPSKSMAAPTTSSSKGPVLAQPISFPQQPTPPIDTTPSPVQLPHHGCGHAHNISFFPPPPTSSDAASSPGRSVYQGYIYRPNPYAYSPQAQANQCTSTTGRCEEESPTLLKHIEDGASPYYIQDPAFHPLGSQPPLTPSATPFNNMAQQWDYINGYQPPESLAYNYLPQSPPSPLHNAYAADIALKSGSPTSPLTEEPSIGLQTTQDEIPEMDKGFVRTGDDLQDISVEGPFDQPPLVAYLQRGFNLKEYADCRLILKHINNRFKKTEWLLSSLLLAQSPKLREMLQSSASGTDGKKVINLTLGDRFVTPKAVESVLRVCYGASPYVFTGVDPQGHFQKKKAEVLVPWMIESLSYAAAGCLLQLEDVIVRGLCLAFKCLDWENLELALSFGLESDFERATSASVGVIPAYRCNTVNGTLPSSGAFICVRPADGLETEGASSASSSTLSSEGYDPPPPQSAFDLLMYCLRFITDNFPVLWELDTSARPLPDVDRLPVTVESRSPLSKSRLSRIQFGDLPSEATIKSGDRDVLISTILLSLPSVWLDYLVKSVGEPIQRNLSSIVKERERRRQIVLQSPSVELDQRMAAKDYEWAEAGYTESVKTSKSGKMMLSRLYTGIARDSPDDSTVDPKF